MYDDNNYTITIDIANKLNLFKDYIAAYTNPRCGNILVGFEEKQFLLNLQCIGDGPVNLKGYMDKHPYLFDDDYGKKEESIPLSKDQLIRTLEEWNEVTDVVSVEKVIELIKNNL